MQWETVLYDRVDDDIVKITLNRPERLNAQDARLLRELDEAVVTADRDDSVKVVILTGAGRGFSAGHDMKGLNPGVFDIITSTPEERREFENVYFFEYCLRIRNVRKPVIAQVHGACVAAGWMVASMCDIIVASDDAYFANPVLRMAAAGVELLTEPYDVGFRKAKEMLWTGDRISAEEALRWGAINKVVPREALEEETLNLARRICLTPSYTIRLSKATFNYAQDLQGWRAAQEHHHEVHLMGHLTKEAADFFKSVGRSDGMTNPNLKEFLGKRDAGYVKDK